MIRINEIMYGDFFRVNRDGLCIKNGTIVQVRGIDGDDKLEKKGLVGAAHCHPLDKYQFDGGIWVDYLDPIPLTTEILEKNEWRCFNTYHEYSHPKAPFDLRQQKDGGYTIEVEADEYGSATFLFILYVHQLQNTLRLCGIEKEITL